MHILIIPSWYPKNPEDINGIFFREQAIALRDHGYKIGIIFPQLRPPSDIKGTLRGPYGIKFETDNNIPIIRYHGTKFLYMIPYINSWIWTYFGMKLFRAYVNRYGNPDIIHAHSLLNAGLLASSIYKRYGINYLVTEHSSSYQQGLIKPWQKKLALHAASLASYRIAVSDQFAEILKCFFNVDMQWDHIPNMLSESFEKNCNIHFENRSDFFIFCNVSIMTPIKAMDVLLQAFSIAFADNKKVKLNIGGDGTLLLHLKKLAKDLCISDQLEFLGMLNRNQVKELFKRSHSYVMSSHIETFGVVLIEALALGMPVIATRCGGPESIVRSLDGYLVPKNNVDALANAMLKMYNNYNQFDHKEIRSSCLNRFSKKSVIQNLSNIYQTINESKIQLKET